MPTPDQFILIHANQRVYDPQKAHDYYIRTRQLKGRRPGVLKVAPRTGGASRLATARAGSQTKPELITVQRQKEVQARVTALRGKLKILTAILQQLVKEAQGPSAPKTKKTKSVATKTKAAGSKDRKALTGAQKQEKAKKAKVAYRKAHPKSEQDRKDRERKQKIDEVRAKIEEVKAQLKDALARARETTKNQPPVLGR